MQNLGEFKCPKCGWGIREFSRPTRPQSLLGSPCISTTLSHEAKADFGGKPVPITRGNETRWVIREAALQLSC